MPKLKPNQFLMDGHLITERPILFQTEMVKANMEDRKMQTRREVKNVTLNELPSGKIEFIHLTKTNGLLGRTGKDDLSCRFLGIGSVCPYGKPGDLLWVRETWARVLDTDSSPFYAYKVDFPFSVDRWKPSIHMPKTSARLWLMVEDIRVERVQDISEADAVAESCSPYGPFGEFRGSPHPNGGAMKYRAYAKASYAFQCIWEEINGKASWKANPWLWVIQYRILSKTGRPGNDLILKNHLEITGKEVPNE